MYTHIYLTRINTHTNVSTCEYILTCVRVHEQIYYTRIYTSNKIVTPKKMINKVLLNSMYIMCILVFVYME